MNRLPLDPSALQVESFGTLTITPNLAAPQTYPDCPTATGCTCIAACQSVVQACIQTVATDAA